MGVMHFHVDRPDLLTAGSDLSQVDFLLYDGRVVPAKATLNGNVLKCNRTQTDSGQLRIAWPRFDGRRQVVHTGSLREQPGPYDLEVELARGQLARLRNQHSIWTSVGLQTTPELESMIVESHRAFRSAVLKTEFPEVSGPSALLSMELSGRATELLCQYYTEQRLTFRRNRTSYLPVFMGCQLQRVPQQESLFLNSFNAIQVTAPWSMLEPNDGAYEWDQTDELVEWAQKHRMFIMGGPLVDLSVDHMPSWLRSWSGDLTNLQSFTADFVETVVGRYVGRIRHWEVVTGANCGGVGDLNEEQRMNLVARVVEAARQVDEHILISIRVAQPWGEYLGRTNNRLPPYQMVETLRRCGVPLAEINLEVRVADSPGKTLCRDSLSLSQLLDYWSLAQLPINVMLTSPYQPSLEDPRLDEYQAEWLNQTLLMCLSKERVVGAYYMNWNDHTIDGGKTALISPDGTVRPTMEVMQRLRNTYWAG